VAIAILIVGAKIFLTETKFGREIIREQHKAIEQANKMDEQERMRQADRAANRVAVPVGEKSQTLEVDINLNDDGK